MRWLRASGLVGAIVWAAAGVCAAWAVMRTFGIEQGFPLQAVIAWTPFMVPVSLAAACLALVARRRSAAGVSAIAAVFLLIAVVPRMLGGGHEPNAADGRELRVMSANLKLGQADPAEVVTLVRENDIDVLCIQELTPELAEDLRAAGLSDVLTRSVGEPRESSHGSAIMARYPLMRQRSVEPPGYPFVMPRATVAIPGAPSIDVVSVHPVPPTGSGAVETWEDGLESLPATGGSDSLTLLVGDFNATLDHRELREVIEGGYVDAADVTGHGLTPTWPERLVRPGVTIDHVLADERVAVIDYEVHELPGSDHRAVAATLRLPRA